LSERTFFVSAEIEYEAPNNNLGRFEGNLSWKGKTLPLKNDNVLLRGTRLRNTHWAFGSKDIERRKNSVSIISILVVCYAGPDTKLMKNSGKATFKRTKIDHLLNRIILGVRIERILLYKISFSRFRSFSFY
jgi:phospholipid-translocating ATPase